MKTSAGGIFFCRVNFLNVRGGLGRGERIDDNFFVTNDSAVIRSLVSPQHELGMGTMEYESFLHAPVAAYSRLGEIQDGLEQYKLVEHLMLLDKFETVFWLYADCCVGHELGFLVRGPQIWSNIHEGIRTLSDCTQATLDISADRLRDLIRLYRVLLKPNTERKDASTSPPALPKDNMSEAVPDLTSKTQFAVYKFHTKANSNRISRALDFVSRAQKTGLLTEKIAYYCSCFEALLSTSQQELSHQVAERVAVIASAVRTERLSSYRFVKECYGLRSKYVHGSPLKATEESQLSGTCKSLDDLLRQTFTKIANDDDLFDAILHDEKLDDLMLTRLFA